MLLKENTSRALKTWINRDTWHTNHFLDVERFYTFVDHYAREHGTSLDEGALIEEISERLRESDRFTEGLLTVARARVSLANHILEFLKATGREATQDTEDEELDL